MGDLLMLDSIEVSTFAGLKFDALAGYVGGTWPDFSSECTAYPALHAQGRILSIAISASEDAECLDVEPGDATPAQAPGWVERQLARKVWRPCIYANLSTWRSGLEASLAHHGGNIRRWVADWTYHPGITVPGFDAQQWTDRYLGRNIDASSCLASFFPPKAQPPVDNGPHYEWFPTGPYTSHQFGDLNECQVVETYDAVRKTAHPDQQVLGRLESKLLWLSDRVRFVAMHLHPNADGSPSWGLDHRGWRYQQLVKRAHGQRFV